MSDKKENTEVAAEATIEQPAAAEVKTEAKPKKQAKTAKEAPAEAEPAQLSRQKLQECGRAAVKRHGLREAWVTSDGQVFAQEGDAKNHARSLKVKDTLNVKA